VRLYCKTTRPIVTEDHDFVPAGTQVRVLGWVYDDTGMADKAKVECEAAAYVYVDTMEDAVGRDLRIQVDIHSLKFMHTWEEG